MDRYVIRVAGHLAPRWIEWLEGLELRHEADGTTLLSGPLPDQSALFGILTKIRDLNLMLLSVARVPASDADACEE